MQRDFDIIILSLCRHDDPFSSTSYSLAKQFAKNNRVFYMDHPFSYKDYLTGGKNEKIQNRREALLFGSNVYKSIPGYSGNLTVVTPRLTFPVNFIQNEDLYNRFSRINDRILFTTIRKLVKDFEIKNYIFINSFDPFFARYFPADFKPKLNIYQTVDDISQETYIARHGVRLEKEAIAKADLTLATSRELCRLKSKYSSKIYYLPNAADLPLFKKGADQMLPVPRELVGNTRKVIVYTGNIGLRMDYNLLRKVALVHKDKILLMVGPFGNDEYKKAGLDRLSNVLFTGKKDIKELPAYLQHADCAIIPFENSILTRSIYPLKINEYLAAGKPVVTTEFSEDIREFKDVALVARNDQEFLSFINKAIDEDSEEKQKQRIKVAQGNSWESRVERFWMVIESFLERKKQGQILKAHLSNN